MTDAVEIFTDGACRGNPGPGGWGAVLRYGEHEKLLCGRSSATTNNRMELTAAIEALQALRRPCRVRLATDSTYLKNGIHAVDRDMEAQGLEDCGPQACEEQRLVAAAGAGGIAAPDRMGMGARPRRQRGQRKGGRARSFRH